MNALVICLSVHVLAPACVLTAIGSTFLILTLSYMYGVSARVILVCFYFSPIHSLGPRTFLFARLPISWQPMLHCEPCGAVLLTPVFCHVCNRPHRWRMAVRCRCCRQIVHAVTCATYFAVTRHWYCDHCLFPQETLANTCESFYMWPSNTAMI